MTLQYVTVAPLIFLTTVLGAAGTTAKGASPRDEAARIVERLGVPAKARVTLKVADVGKDEVGRVRRFEQALRKELVGAGMRLVDSASLAKRQQELAAGARLGGADEVETAAHQGADYLIASRLELLPTGPVIELKAVAIGSGRVVGTARVDLPAGEQQPAPGERMSLRARIRRLADHLKKGLDAVEGNARYQSFGVLVFEEIGETTKEKQLGKLLTAELTSFLMRDHGLFLVERSALDAVINELALGQSGLLDESRAAEVGKLAGADALVAGTVSEAGDSYLVNAKVVEVVEGRVVLTEQEALPATDLVALSSEAVVLRTRTGAFYRSLLLPGWGQVYNRQSIKGAAFAGAAVIGAALATTFHFQGAAEERRYTDVGTPLTPDVFDGHATKAEDLYGKRNLAIYALITIHLLNVLDAVVNGKTFDSATAGSGGSVWSARW